MAAFPVAKLGVLILKQVSKPIANACKNYAKSSQFFRTYICMPPAQLYHWSEVKMKMWILNLGKPVNIPVLNEQQAIELGANLLGEAVLFLIASVILVSEYNRSSAKDAKKEAAIKAEKQGIEQSLQELYFNSQKQATQINELVRIVYDLGGKVVPSQSGKKPISPILDLEKPPPQKPPPAPDMNPSPAHDTSKFAPPQQEPPPAPDMNPCPDLDTPKLSQPDDSVPQPENTSKVNKMTKLSSSSLLGCAYEFVENDLFTDKERATSIVNLGINHLFNNVYRIPVST